MGHRQGHLGGLPVASCCRDGWSSAPPDQGSCPLPFPPGVRAWQASAPLGGLAVPSRPIRPAGPPLSCMLLPCRPRCPLPVPSAAVHCHTLPFLDTFWLGCHCSHHGALLSRPTSKSWFQSPAYLDARGAQGVRLPLPKPERVRVSLSSRLPQTRAPTPRTSDTGRGAGPPTGPTSLGRQLLVCRGPHPAPWAFPWALSATRAGPNGPPVL